jgi:hypothetical protein
VTFVASGTSSGRSAIDTDGRHAVRFKKARRWLGVTAAMVALGAFAPDLALADQAGTVTLRGYGGVAEQVFTTENTYQIYTSVGNASGNTSQFYISIYPANFPETFRRTDIYFILPGPLQTGTFSASGGFGSTPGLVMQGFSLGVPGFGVFCDGGTFTVNDVDTSSPWGLKYDLSWTQDCNGTPASGHAVFTPVIPPDTRPPVIDDTWRWEIAETTASGTEVFFTRTATDDRDPNPVVVCDPPSGSWFPLGMNHTTCVATDNAGNSSEPVEIVVLVLGPDVDPPYFSDTPNIIEDATGPDGATVGIWVSAVDDRGAVTLSCTRSPGDTPIEPWGYTTFPINAKGENTVVTCNATDSVGNQAEPRSFTVHIRGAGEQTEGLASTITEYNLGKLGTSLQDKLVAVTRHLAAGRKSQACEAFDSFVNQVDAQVGKGLQEWQALYLRYNAQRLQALIGC